MAPYRVVQCVVCDGDLHGDDPVGDRRRCAACHASVHVRCARSAPAPFGRRDLLCPSCGAGLGRVGNDQGVAVAVVIAALAIFLGAMLGGSPSGSGGALGSPHAAHGHGASGRRP